MGQAPDPQLGRAQPLPRPYPSLFSIFIPTFNLTPTPHGLQIDTPVKKTNQTWLSISFQSFAFHVAATGRIRRMIDS